MDVMNNPKKYFWITLFQSCSFLAPLSTLFYLSRGLGYQQIFLLMMVIVISMFIFEVPTGIIGDKYGRKTSIVIGLIGGIIISIGLLFANSFFQFLMLFTLLGFNLTFASGSDEALIYDSLKQSKKQNQMQRHMGKIMSARFLPLIIIAPLGSIIAKDLLPYQFNILILGNIIFALIAFFIALSLVEPKLETGLHEIKSYYLNYLLNISKIPLN